MSLSKMLDTIDMKVGRTKSKKNKKGSDLSFFGNAFKSG